MLQLYIDRGTNAHDSGFITTNNNRPFQMATNFQINTLVAGDVVVIAFLRMKITVFYSHNALITASKRFCVSVNLRWKRFEVPTPLKLRFHFWCIIIDFRIYERFKSNQIESKQNSNEQ